MERDLWRRAEGIFHSALERPIETRREFLTEACGENTDLRRQVEKPISFDARTDLFSMGIVLYGMAKGRRTSTIGHWRSERR